MDRKSFIARLIAVPAALLGIKKAVADTPDYRDLQPIGEYKELTIAQIRARASSIRKYPLTFEETAEYEELRRMIASDFITYGQVSFAFKPRYQQPGFASVSFKGKTYHFYKGALIGVE